MGHGLIGEVTTQPNKIMRKNRAGRAFSLWEKIRFQLQVSFFHFLAVVDLLWVKQLTVLMVGEDLRQNAPDRDDMKHRKAV